MTIRDLVIVFTFNSNIGSFYLGGLQMGFIIADKYLLITHIADVSMIKKTSLKCMRRLKEVIMIFYMYLIDQEWNVGCGRMIIAISDVSK